VERRGKDDKTTDNNIVRHMLFACWIIKATDTQSEYVIFTAFPLEKVTRTLLILRLYVHCLSSYLKGPKTDSACDFAMTLYFSHTKVH